MKFGLSVPQFSNFADIAFLADLAKDAEEAGWNGFFIWDHILFDDLQRPVVDPWIALAAISLNTNKIRLGTMVTPLARRRPWKVAREAASIDQLSQGRLILGVGLGAPAQWEFGAFGEEVDTKVRARRLDEGLEILLGLLSGEPFSYQGEFYNLDEMVFLPRPVQNPSIPIWVGGTWPNKGPIYRAAKYDGYFPDALVKPVAPKDWIKIQTIIESQRGSVDGFDLVQYGVTPGDDPAAAASIMKPYLEVGVTWWVEGISPFDYGLSWTDPWEPDIIDKLVRRVQNGPPSHI